MQLVSRAQKKKPAAMPPKPPADGEGAQEEEVEEVPAAKDKMDWDVNKRKELLFQQIIGVGAKAFLTNRANIKPNNDGTGGVQYDKKNIWNEKILEPLKKAAEFAGAVWPIDHQGVLNYVERIISKSKHLYTSGEEQNEPAEAGTEGTKDEKFSDWQKVSRPRAPRAQPCLSHHSISGPGFELVTHAGHHRRARSHG